MSGEVVIGVEDPRTHRCRCGKAIALNRLQCRTCVVADRRLVFAEDRERAEAMRAAGLKPHEVAERMEISLAAAKKLLRAAQPPVRRSSRAR